MWLRFIAIFLTNCCVRLWRLLKQSINWRATSTTKSLCVKNLNLKSCHGTEWRSVATVKQIFIYPLKYGREIACHRCSFTYSGITTKYEDFELRTEMFVIYNNTTKCILNKNMRKLKEITIIIQDKFTVILRTFNGLECALYIKNLDTTDSIECTSHFCKKFLIKYECVDCGSTSAKWISSFLGDKDLRLGYRLPEAHTRNTFWQHYDSGYQLNEEERNIELPYACIPICTIMSMNSLHDLYNKISYPIRMNSYCANIIFSCEAPYVENKWDWLKIGNAVFRNIKPWISTIDPRDVPVDMKLKELAVHCELISPGEVEIGDNIYISTRTEKNII